MTTRTRLILRLTGSLIAAASFPALSQLHLAPIYGALPASANHHTLTTITILTGLLAGPYNVTPQVLRHALPIAISRPLFELVLLYGTRHAGATLGPLLLEATLFMPLLCVVVAQTHTVLLELRSRVAAERSFWEKVLMPPLLFAALLMLEAWASSIITGLCATGHVLVSRWILQLVLCDLPVVFTIPLTSRAYLLWLLFALLVIFWCQTQTYIPKHRETNWSVLAYGESVTGYISVLENTELQYRLLRCDHSLLGGEWLLTEQRQREEAWEVAEPVFGVFAMLEAVRLVQGPNTQSAAQKKDSETSALVM